MRERVQQAEVTKQIIDAQGLQIKGGIPKILFQNFISGLEGDALVFEKQFFVVFHFIET